MNREIWKPVNGYEGIYEVSNKAEVRSIDRYVNGVNGSMRFIKGKLIIPHINNNGYLLCDLYKENKRKNYLLHRIVAEAFIPNPQNYEVVNHKDNVRTNCLPSNLEWCNMSYNHKYSYDYNNRKEKMNWRKGKENKLSKPIIMKDLNGKFIKRFDSISCADRYTGISNNRIVACLKGRTKTCGGFLWEYAN